MLAKPLTSWTLVLLCVSQVSAGASVVLLEQISHVERSFSGLTLDGAGSIQTGKDGMAELQSGKAIIRLGNNTKLLNKTDGELQLEHGNLLFENLSPGDSLVLISGGGRLRVSGALGFIQIGDANSTVIGGMAGKTKVVVAGNEYELGPGEMFSVLPSGRQIKGNFNLAKQAKDSRLVHGFKHELAGLHDLKQSVRNFAKLENRGFVRSSDSQDPQSDNGVRLGSSSGGGTLGQYFSMAPNLAEPVQNNHPTPAVLAPTIDRPPPPPPFNGWVGAVAGNWAINWGGSPVIIAVPPLPAGPNQPGAMGVVMMRQQRAGNNVPLPPMPPIPNAAQSPAQIQGLSIRR
jgi:hypothetical protein